MQDEDKQCVCGIDKIYDIICKHRRDGASEKGSSTICALTKTQNARDTVSLIYIYLNSLTEQFEHVSQFIIFIDNQITRIL